MRVVVAVLAVGVALSSLTVREGRQYDGNSNNGDKSFTVGAVDRAWEKSPTGGREAKKPALPAEKFFRQTPTYCALRTLDDMGFPLVNPS
ncbi:hypothetical protein DNL40_16110, partial [Xylanimonas oleitrophica]